MGQVNISIFGKVLLEIEKNFKTFSIFDKTFPKLVYYCVPLRHTLVNSLIMLLEFSNQNSDFTS